MQEDQSQGRYHRQMVLRDFGQEGQRRLKDASILVVGAGGLGCPALQYLVGAGVGQIGVADGDIVGVDNLHRQPLYGMQDIGRNKAVAAAEALSRLNPEVEIRVYPSALANAECMDTIPRYDIVLDCTDNIPSRYLLNDACAILGKTLVWAAVSRYEGQVAVFNHGRRDGGAVNYRDLFPEPPHPDAVSDCATAGVLGMAAGIVGALQAAEAVKLLTGIGRPLTDRILTIDIRSLRFHELEISKRPASDTRMPSDAGAFLETDYPQLCLGLEAFRQIEPEQLEDIASEPGTLVVDLRELGETPELRGIVHLRSPLSELQQGERRWDCRRLVLICQSGVRSRQAARRIAMSEGKPSEILSLNGGAPAWNRYVGKKSV